MNDYFDSTDTYSHNFSQFAACDAVIFLNKAASFFSVGLIHICSWLSHTWHIFNLCPTFFRWLTPAIIFWVLECVSSWNCALSFFQNLSRFHICVKFNKNALHNNQENHFFTIVITTDKKQVDMQQYVLTVIYITSPIASRMILFYAGISALEKISLIYIWTSLVQH